MHAGSAFGGIAVFSPRDYRHSLLRDRILAPPRDVGFEKLFLCDAHLEADSATQLSNNPFVPRAGTIADWARLLIDAFDDLFLALV